MRKTFLACVFAELFFSQTSVPAQNSDSQSISQAISIARSGSLGRRGTDAKLKVIDSLLNVMSGETIANLVASLPLPSDSLFGDLWGELKSRV